MGWASGSALGIDLWQRIRKHVPADKRQIVARAIIEELEGHDCDTINECEQLVKDADWEKKYFGEGEEE